MKTWALKTMCLCSHVQFFPTAKRSAAYQQSVDCLSAENGIFVKKDVSNDDRPDQDQVLFTKGG